MRNFFDCVRSAKSRAAHLELGFNSAIACQMAIASLRQGAPFNGIRYKMDIV